MSNIIFYFGTCLYLSDVSDSEVNCNHQHEVTNLVVLKADFLPQINDPLTWEINLRRKNGHNL